MIWPQLVFLVNSPSLSLPLTTHWLLAHRTLSSASVTLSSVPLVYSTSCLHLLGSSFTLQATRKDHPPVKTPGLALPWGMLDTWLCYSP